MKKKTLKELCKELIKDWEEYKVKAVETGNFEFYLRFLKIVQKEFGELYAEVRRPESIILVEQVLKIASCEIKEIMIKYKKKKD